MTKEVPILKLEGLSDLAIGILEKRTGLKLAGFSDAEIKHRVAEWTKSRESISGKAE
jgi:hypothetical protein